jgi:hypothetical protein
VVLLCSKKKRGGAYTAHPLFENSIAGSLIRSSSKTGLISVVVVVVVVVVVIPPSNIDQHNNVARVNDEIVLIVASADSF